jgi:hypothetical protein
MFSTDNCKESSVVRLSERICGEENLFINQISHFGFMAYRISGDSHNRAVLGDSSQKIYCF